MEKPKYPNPIEGGEYETRREVPDFKKIFSERLASVEPLSEEASRDLSIWYQDAGIIGIKKEVPAIIFRSGGKSNDQIDSIWIENSNVVERERDSFIHNRVSKELTRFLGGEERPDPLSGYLIEDNEGLLHMTVDLQIGSAIRNNRESEDEDYKNLLDTMRAYNIFNIIEKASKRQERMAKRGVLAYQNRIPEALLDQTMVEKRREGIFLVNLAQKYSMTNTQYMRLKILADTLHRSGVQSSLEEIAKSIVEDSEGTGIDVKNTL